jgi:6-pyruvoyltetrahydropterin/6-carboxytetrahydropterin synthase
MWELTKSFPFEAAHAVSGTTLGAASEEIHGHSFRAEVTISGSPNSHTGMIVDLGALERSLADVRRLLDHKLLNRVESLGAPTLENLSRFIYDRLAHLGSIKRVTVYRDSRNEACTYFGPTSHAP